MPSSKDIIKAFRDDGTVIDVTPSTTAGEMVQSMGYDPKTTELVQKSKSGLPKIIKSNDRFDPRNGQEIDIQMIGIEGK